MKRKAAAAHFRPLATNECIAEEERTLPANLHPDPAKVPTGRRSGLIFTLTRTQTDTGRLTLEEETWQLADKHPTVKIDPTRLLLANRRCWSVIGSDWVRNMSLVSHGGGAQTQDAANDKGKVQEGEWRNGTKEDQGQDTKKKILEEFVWKKKFNNKVEISWTIWRNKRLLNFENKVT